MKLDRSTHRETFVLFWSTLSFLTRLYRRCVWGRESIFRYAWSGMDASSNDRRNVRDVDNYMRREGEQQDIVMLFLSPATRPITQRPIINQS